MTDFLYDTALTEQLTYARQARSAWLWTDDAARKRILLNVLDTLRPACSALARACADETRCGIFEDKLLLLDRLLTDLRTDCLAPSSNSRVCLSWADTRTENHPSGTLAAVTSALHPAAEVLFACAIALRTGNPIIFSFHPDAFQVSLQTAVLIRDAAVRAGAPDNCIQWLENSDDNFIQKMNDCPDISGLILAGLSSDIQKYFSAFSKACILAFPQASFCYVHHSASPEQAAGKIVLSKTVDNGLNYNSEQIICADHDILLSLKNALHQEGCYFASPEEIIRLTAVLADLSTDNVNPSVIGQSSQTLAALADITIPDDTRLIVLEIEPDTASHPLLLPLLCPVLVLMSVDDNEQAAEKIRLLSTKNDDFSTDSLFTDTRRLPSPHSLVIHTGDTHTASVLTRALPGFTLIENAPAASHSITRHYVDAFGNALTPAAVFQIFTAHCCHSTITEKARHFSSSAEIFYEKNALDRLVLQDNETHILFLQNHRFSDAEVQTVIQKILQKYPFIQYERQRLDDNPSEIPDFRCQLSLFPELPTPSPDCLIVIGDAAAVNIAKMMMHRYQMLAAQNLTSSNFTAQNSAMPRLIVITADTGCHEALLPFCTHYDSHTNRLIDTNCQLPPFTIIADAGFSFSRSRKTWFSACMAAMADAFDALLSTKGDDLSDAPALRAIQLFLTWLPELLCENLYETSDLCKNPVPCKNPVSDRISESSQQKNRPDACLEHLQNACILSGMACSHTGPGLSRILAQQLCCEFRIPMNILQGILLPHLLLYYGDAHPSRKAWNCSTSAYSANEHLKMLISANPAIDSNCRPSAILAGKLGALLDDARLPANIKSCNIREKDYLQRIDDLALRSFEQLSTNCADAGPRYPLVKELVQILRDIY